MTDATALKRAIEEIATYQPLDWLEVVVQLAVIYDRQRYIESLNAKAVNHDLENQPEE